MRRRQFLTGAASAAAAHWLAGCGPRLHDPTAPTTGVMDARAYQAARRMLDTRFGKIAYVERGHGPVALFLHGYPLNGFQWRGALERLSPIRRCVAADFLGLGYTETGADQDLSPHVQAEMLIAVLDALAIDAVDLVANDSGGTVAQLLAVEHPDRVRTMLLTDCDVHENSPPAKLRPFIELARAGRGAKEWLAPQLADPAFARSDKGLGGGAYTRPEHLTDEAIAYYFTPLLSSPLRMAQFDRYAVAFEPNPLVAIEPALKRCTIPARIVWGTNDQLFDTAWAAWLDRTLPRSTGVRLVPGAKLFFPEEMPDLIAAEARRLWGA